MERDYEFNLSLLCEEIISLLYYLKEEDLITEDELEEHIVKKVYFLKKLK